MKDYLHDINGISKIDLLIDGRKTEAWFDNKSSRIVSKEFVISESSKSANVEVRIETILGKNNPIVFGGGVEIPHNLLISGKTQLTNEIEELSKKRTQEQNQLQQLINQQKIEREKIGKEELERSQVEREKIEKEKLEKSILNSHRYYTKSVGIVIGINKYFNWPSLEYAVADANAVEKKIHDMNFDTIIKILDKDATRNNILSVLGHKIPYTVSSNDRVIIYFAGHGQTESLPNGGEEGYIIPVDADLENYFTTAISMTQLRSLTDRIPAKHILYVMDSCYSGLGIKRGIRRNPETIDRGYIDKISSMKAVQIITAGGRNEQVIERNGHGLFTTYFLRALGGEADYNNDGVVTSLEIGTFVKPSVSNASHQKQTPQYGIIDGEGEILFITGK